MPKRRNKGIGHVGGRRNLGLDLKGRPSPLVRGRASPAEHALDGIALPVYQRSDNLIVVPLPDAGGPLSIVGQSRSGISITHEYEMIRSQLLGISDLALVVIDPLQSFTYSDINKDPAAAQYG